MTYELDPFQKVVYLPTTVTIVPDFSTRNEGQSVIFTLTVTNALADTSYYVKLEGVTGSIADKDFTNASAISGSFFAGFNVLVDTPSFVRTITATLREDVKTEGTESFRAIVKLDNPAAASNVAVSIPVTILDTSVQQWAEVTAGGSGVDNGYWSGVGANDVQWNHDGTSVAWAHRNPYYDTATPGYTVSVFNRSGATLTRIASLGPTILYSAAVSWNSTGTLLAFAGAGGGVLADRGLKVYSRSSNSFTLVFSDTSVTSFTDTTAGGQVRFSPSGTRLAVITGSAIRIYSVSGTTITLLFNNTTYGLGNTLGWNPASTRIAVGFSNSNFYRIYNAVSNTWIALLADDINHNGINNTVNSIAYSPDGSLLIAGVAGSYNTTPDHVGLVHWTVSGDTYTRQSYQSNTAAYTISPPGSGLFNGKFYEAKAVAFSPDGTKVVLGLFYPNTMDPTSTSGQDTGITIGVFSRSGGTLTWNKSYGGVGGIYGANGDEPVGNGSPFLKLPHTPQEIHWNPAGTSIAVAVYNNPPYFRIYDIT